MTLSDKERTKETALKLYYNNTMVKREVPSVPTLVDNGKGLLVRPFNRKREQRRIAGMRRDLGLSVDPSAPGLAENMDVTFVVSPVSKKEQKYAASLRRYLKLKVSQ